MLCCPTRGLRLGFVEVRAQRALTQEDLARIKAEYAVCQIRSLAPVLPVMSPQRHRWFPS